MTAYKPKRFPIAPRNALLASTLQSCAVILAINWVFQGMRGMGLKELAFRLGLEALVLALGFTALLGIGLGWPLALTSAAFLAHGVSFTLNGQVWVCARYCRWWRREPEAVTDFAQRVAARLQATGWLEEAAVIGSLAAKPQGTRSDIDLRLIFPRGVNAWWRVNVLLLELRTRAFFARIPLDLYAYDSPEALRRFDQTEPLLVLLDRAGRLRAGFAQRARLA